MAINYTPLDPKKYPVQHNPEGKKEEKTASNHGSKIDAILIGIIVITLVVLGVLLFMLFQKSL